MHILQKDRNLLQNLFFSGLAAVDARESVIGHLKPGATHLHVGQFQISYSDFKHIWIVGAGKATAHMAKAAEEILLDKFSSRYKGGLIVVKEGHGLPLKRVQCLEAGHPVPDKRGEEAASNLLAFVKKINQPDLILCLLSGGASALLPAPSEGLTLHDKISLTETLLRCGADIHEINTLRKHCSRIKGGKLVSAANKAWWLTLAISDVPGDSPESIGSGPTVGDTSTLIDCWNILKKYHIEDQVPANIHHHLTRDTSETPNPNETEFARTFFTIIAKNSDAVQAVKEKAEKNGFIVAPENCFFTQEVLEVAEAWKQLKQKYDSTIKKPYIVICGGEPTVEVKGDGLGGRNMELALRVATLFPGRFTFLSAGTDGSDGPTDAAGAFIDDTTLSRSKKSGISYTDFLNRNDSYTFFDRLGDLFITGPTGTNVMDLQILLVRE